MNRARPIRPASRLPARAAWLLVLALVLLLVSAAVAAAGPPPTAEWPQWRRPERNGTSKETGLLKQWREGGPTLLWTATGLRTSYGTC